MKKSFLASEFPQCKSCSLWSVLARFTVSHGGILDVQRHVKSARHWEIGKVATLSVTTFFGKASNESQNLDVIFTNFLVFHLVTEMCA